MDLNLNDQIERGVKIGIQGTSGNSTGTHLHFETWNRIPCNTSNKPENCWLSQYYLDSRMLPQFDECYQARGGLANTYPDCTNGYPNKTGGYWYESINSSHPLHLQ
jgi:murein DD-endopeptidase MepM/ murein hydrolase activator NlpD